VEKYSREIFPFLRSMNNARGRARRWDGSSDFIRPCVMRLIKSRASRKNKSRSTDRTLLLFFSLVFYTAPPVKRRDGGRERERERESVRGRKGGNKVETFLAEGRALLAILENSRPAKQINARLLDGTSNSSFGRTLPRSRMFFRISRCFAFPRR